MIKADPLSRRPRVLVVDEDWCVAAVVSMKLREAGLDTIEAGDAETAWRVLCCCRLDLIITEIRLDGEDGLWLSRKGNVHTAACSVPVIIMSGAVHRIYPRDLHRVHVRAVIPKPFSPRELLERSLEVLSERYSLLPEVGPFSEQAA
jgi:DNA-binding response OmpR family regulator